MDKMFFMSKKKLILGFIFLTLITITFILFSVYLTTTEGGSFEAIFLGLVGIITGWCSYLLLKQLIKREPIVILSAEGMTLNGPGGLGFVPWEEINGFLPYKYQMSRFLGIILKDDEYYLNKISNKSRKLAKINQRMGFPPFNLSLSYLKDEHLFFETLSEYEVSFFIADEENQENNH